MIPEIKVDATRAIARFSPQGIPEGVRTALRRAIPDVTRRLGVRVERNLDAGLRSRTHLVVKKEMVEDPRQLVGRVRTLWTGAASASMVPQVLESGARAHEIAAKNANSLFFFWEKIGKNVAFRRVWHPGFAGIFYSRNALADMRSEITVTLRDAVKEGLAEK